MLAVSIGSGTAAPAGGAEVAVLDDQTPWRVFLTIASPMIGTAENCKPMRRGERHRPSPLPPEKWTQGDFDDSAWGRYHWELSRLLGGYGYWQSPEAALLCLRTWFGVADPAKVRDLTLTLACRGGAVVYVNGREVARGHMPKGRIEPLTLAEDYPPAAYVMPDGKTRLPRSNRPAKDHLDRYEARIRTLTVPIGGEVLRKGANLLAVELHRTALLRADWSSLGFCGVKLSSPTGAGLIPYEQATRKLYLWNAHPLSTISATRTGELWFKTSWDRGPLSMSAAGARRGNPFAPLRPVRLVGARNGVCSGQVVVSCPTGLKAVTATISALSHTNGRRLPAEAVRIRYAVQDEGARYCDALLERPAKGVAVQPVWVIVNVPRDQAPGWYTGGLTVRANGRELRAPVQVLVSSWTLPDAKRFVSHASLLQSPDTLALKYNVQPFSQEHFRLIEKSLELQGQVGNDVVYIPVIHGTHMGHRTGMVRWIRQAPSYQVDFSAMEKYLELYARHCGEPKVICLVVWKPTFGNQRSFRGVRVTKPEPVLVTQLEPKTGGMSPLQAPMFGEKGSEAFWKPMLDGARRIVRRRGWDERRLMLGQAFDSRPLPQVQAFFKRIAPWARWVVYSHWNGDPGPRDGRLIVSGELEVGYCQECGGGLLPELHPQRPELRERQYITAGSHRIRVLTWSSPTAYRNIPNLTGTFCRIGLDFWPVLSDGQRRRSIFNTKICGPWLYKAHPRAIVAPGPRGAIPTVRFQMLREGVQEAEAWIFVVTSLQKRCDEDKKRYEGLLSEREVTRRVAGVLTQAQISLDWLGLTSRMYAAAAELAGERTEAAWSSPPAAH